MRQILIVACLFFSQFNQGIAQTLTSSNLPIFIINTDSRADIPDEPKVLATLKIIYRGPGQRNYVTDQDNPAYLNYNGRIGIEVRGSSSQTTYKKQYGFTTLDADNSTNNNVKLLGMPAENDWVLNGMVFDPAMMRDYLSYNLFRQMGEYASRTAYCEMILNDVYKGLYLLQEKIKADDKRVNIVKIDPTDNYVPNITGGYITKADKTTGGDPVAWTMLSKRNESVSFIHELPKPETVTSKQNDYIHNQFQVLEISARNNNYSFESGYPFVIDIPSFIDFMLISELGSNADAYMYSTYYHKDRNGKLRAGPIWDNDLTYGNDLFFWGYDRSKLNVWQFSNGDNEGPRFWVDLFNISLFRCYLSKRWHELTSPGQPLNLTRIEAFIDSSAATIQEGFIRDRAYWETPANQYQLITNIKSFVASRILWITTNIGAYDACSNVPVPPLIITKIMYHPDTTAAFPKEDDLEFIEIHNNGDLPVALAGIYFSGTGLVYQFPLHAVQAPHTSIILASNAAVFLARYGSAPFGEFNRHLSNKGQNLILADGFGNIIDQVQYSDTIPWPEADGNGSYLKVIDANMDNNVASNWTASNEIITSYHNFAADIDLQLYPNPVSELLSIKAGSMMKSLSLTDMQGRMLINVNVSHNSYELDMSKFSNGTYIIRVITTGKIYTGKIIKN